jgi:phenylacetate-CoA ligase
MSSERSENSMGNSMLALIFPLLDRLNGTRVSAIFKFLNESQWWSHDRLIAFQEQKATDMLAWTKEQSDFYRHYWKSAADDRRAASHWRILDGIPVVTKNDLRRGGEEFPLKGYRGRAIRVHTSGSTGEPMQYFRSVEQESWFWALRLRMWTWGGYRIGEPYVTLNLNARTAFRKRIQDVLFRCSYHGFNARENDVAAVIRDLKRSRHLVGYASSLFILSKAIPPELAKSLRLGSLLSTGDTLFPSYRETIETTFGVGVTDYYGAGGEGFHLASQCEHRGDYHLHAENSIVEILTGGRPARDGERGEIVVTQLDNRAMPLIRYATGDVGVAGGTGSCACGRALPLMKSVEGRVPDIVFAPNGAALVVHFFTILFEYIDGIRQFQIVQDEPTAVTVRIVRDNRYDVRSSEQRARKAIGAATADSIAVNFEYVEEIPLARSGKRRLVISRVLPAPLAVHDPAASDSAFGGAHAARAAVATSR